MPEPTKGARRRREILEAAADLSTHHGLDHLSFGRLADEIGITKAGVAAHFASKEALQLAVVELAAEAYDAFVQAARAEAEPGLPRLRALAFAWLHHLETIPYRGGCFFAAAGQAFAGHPGSVRDAIVAKSRYLLGELEEQASLALRLGELASDASPETLAFQIHALAQEANLRRELFGDEHAYALGRAALERLFDLHTAPDSRKEST